MKLPDGPLVAWYGDDFTGAAAVMEVLTFAGFPSVLFFDPPDEGRLARFGTLRAVGVAGDARSRDPAWMETNLPPVFAALRASGAPLVHYKVCSTFDSSAEVGSIGKAADLALGADDWAPLLVAAPDIGRWQAFGNLFAKAGDTVHRLDRHPTMAIHPVTPMDEADVRRHLGKQTVRGIGLVDLVDLKAGRGEAALARERAGGNTIVAIDVVDAETLAAAGALLWHEALKQPLFAVGSQGVEYALVAGWRSAGLAAEPASAPTLRAVDRIAVVSGSCSPITAGQIDHAEADGFGVVALDPAAATDPGAWDTAKGAAVERALALLSEGRDPLICTARGPHDGSVKTFREAIAQSRNKVSDVNTRIGAGLGEILDRIVREAKLTRAAIAGGDTSSAAARSLGIYAVTAEAVLAPGAALLKGHGDDPVTDGLELALKGGQMGPPDFFTRLRAGDASARS